MRKQTDIDALMEEKIKISFIEKAMLIIFGLFVFPTIFYYRKKNKQTKVEN